MMRVPIQAFVAPWISALLFIFIFGYVVGGRINAIGGHRYLEFVLPGIVMMNVVNAAFLQSSSQVYFSRFLHYIEETLVSPLSYIEMIMGSLSVVVLRSSFTGLGILVIATFFGVTSIYSLPEFIFWTVGVSIVFGLLGIMIGLWAKNFEQLNVLTVFFITPLSMVGGVFNTTDMLPGYLSWLTLGNPFFYFVNGLRHAMIGYGEVSQAGGIIFTLAMIAILGAIVWKMYATGYGIRK
jgi:ABC-2 type transport system permease protein